MFGLSFSVLEVPRICFSAWGLFLGIEEPLLIWSPEIYWLFVIAKLRPQTIWRSYLRIVNVAAILTSHRLFWSSSHSKVDKFRLRILCRLGFGVEPRGRSKPIAKRLHVSRVGWLQQQNNDHQTWGHCSQMHVVQPVVIHINNVLVLLPQRGVGHWRQAWDCELLSGRTQYWSVPALVVLVVQGWTRCPEIAQTPQQLTLARWTGGGRQRVICQQLSTGATESQLAPATGRENVCGQK